MTRTLCYGGSFDPIHYGHLRCSKAVAEAGGFGQILLIPSWQSPHKLEAATRTSPNDRLAMCKAATSGEKIFEVTDLEIRRGGPSYTIDTVRALKQMGMPEINWLIGADQVPALPRWREPQALVTEANVIVMGRPNYAIEWDNLPVWLHGLRRNVVDIPLVDISATDIRLRVAQGESIDELVSPGVVKYIAANGLYRAT